MYILGIGGISHDGSACILEDGNLLAAAEEERFTRVKHQGGYPKKVIEYCLKKAGISKRDISYIGIYMDYRKRLFKKLGFHGAMMFKKTVTAISRTVHETEILGNILIMERELKRAFPNAKIHFIDHHICHAASAFFVSPFNDAAILIADNLGELATTFLGIGQDAKISKLSEVRYPNSLGVFYSLITGFLGFTVGDAEYKVMGLASYGKPEYLDSFREILTINGPGSFELNAKYISYGKLTKKFYKRFGYPRVPESEISEHHKNLAASLQARLEEVIFELASHLYGVTKKDNLIYGGGIALNSVLNGKLFKNTPYKKIYIQPAPGDNGASMGSAYYIYHQILEGGRTFELDHPYWGPEYYDNEILYELNKNKMKYEICESSSTRAAELIRQGKIVGWFQGRMEWGPRALGNRSILADPTRADMQDIVNKFVKHREDFRPFAPSVLEERASEYFEISQPDPFMLFVVDVLPEKKNSIPAVVHVDGSARVQTVNKDTNPRYWELINEFGRLSGVPVVLNTSFNVRGEPIVMTPRDALRCFYSTGMDYLFLGNYLVSK
ncbi:carbamoyltransferase [Patescibacteria group bacterium]|nr:carbamoyltransferase [Patescibacteria group bacterium]